MRSWYKVIFFTDALFSLYLLYIKNKLERALTKFQPTLLGIGETKLT